MMKKFESDEELVAECLKLKPQAQRALYDKFVQAMYNTVYRYTFDHHDTQDILQEGFSRVFTHLDKYNKEKGKLLSWVRKIHVHCALDFLKKKQDIVDDLDDIVAIPCVQTIAFEKLEVEYILQFIEELDPRERVIFNMHHIEGFSHREIAEVLSININSSRVYLARARKTLRDKISAFQTKLSIAQ